MPVQMIEADLQGLIDEGFGDLGANEPPAVLMAVLRGVAITPEVRTYLRALGRWLARRALTLAKEVLFEDRPEPPAPWLQALMPFLDEVFEGASAELRRQARPWAWGLAAITGLAGVGIGALIGRSRRKMYERGRAEASR